jgi:hypothetical protein
MLNGFAGTVAGQNPVWNGNKGPSRAILPGQNSFIYSPVSFPPGATFTHATSSSPDFTYDTPIAPAASIHPGTW